MCYRSESFSNLEYTRYTEVEQRHVSSKVTVRVYDIYGALDGEETLLVMNHYDNWGDAMREACVLTGVTPPGEPAH